jgi:hypothetical protein
MVVSRMPGSVFSPDDFDCAVRLCTEQRLQITITAEIYHLFMDKKFYILDQVSAIANNLDFILFPDK